MRNVGTVLAQVLICLLVAGALVPALLVAFPTLQAKGPGSFVAFGCPVLIFVVLQLVWPRQTQ